MDMLCSKAKELLAKRVYRLIGQNDFSKTGGHNYSILIDRAKEVANEAYAKAYNAMQERSKKRESSEDLQEFFIKDNVKLSDVYNLIQDKEALNGVFRGTTTILKDDFNSIDRVYDFGKLVEYAFKEVNEVSLLGYLTPFEIFVILQELFKLRQNRFFDTKNVKLEEQSKILDKINKTSQICLTLKKNEYGNLILKVNADVVKVPLTEVLDVLRVEYV